MMNPGIASSLLLAILIGGCSKPEPEPEPEPDAQLGDGPTLTALATLPATDAKGASSGAIAAPNAWSQAIAERRQAYETEREEGLRARNQAMGDLREQLFAAESAKAYFTDRLAEMGSPDYTPPPGILFNTPRSIVEAFIEGMEYIDCSKPFVYGLVGEPYVEPGMHIILVGCSFGLRQGELRLVVNPFGGHFKLDILDWDDDRIYAIMPPYESMNGLVDHDWHLQVFAFGPPPALGPRSNKRAVKFRATREIIPAFGAYVGGHVTTNHPNSPDVMIVPALVCDNPPLSMGPKIYQVQWSVGAYHEREWDSRPARVGTDHWRLDLINGWVSVIADLERVQMEGPGNLIADPRYSTAGSTTFDAEVDWEVYTGVGIVEYGLNLWIEGPKDTPYSVGFIPGWGLPPDTALPGQPCSGP